MFPKRPTINETEDDILEQQRKFLSQNPDVAKKYVQNPEELDDDDEKNSKKVKRETCPIIDLDFKIVEKNSPGNSSDSFPAENFQVKPAKTMSLYAQRNMKNKIVEKEKIVSNDSPQIETARVITGIGLGTENWQSDMEEIRKENDKIINSMNQDEIEKLREEVMKKLSKETVEFLKSKKFPRRSKVVAKPNPITNSISQNDPLEDEPIEDKIPIKMEEMNQYVHMNVIEKEKLSWMGDIKEDPKKEKPKEELPARFNFEGDLIDSKIAPEIDVHEGLHHHGEEPERPGYTINELMIFLQSSVPAQKQIGLKTFENIITKAYKGFYDSCFNTNLIEYLLKDTPLVLVVRTCLDETSDTVWKSSINTLKALLCNTYYDELFLDRGYLIFEDFLGYGYQIDLNLKPVVEKEIHEEVTDQECLSYDVVYCLLHRTSILERFVYLIKNHLHESDLPFIDKIFDILIRFARHSKESCETIIRSADLMESILAKLISPSSSLLVGQISVIHAKIFKLLRVCMSTIHQDMKRQDQPLPVSLIRLFNKFHDVSIIKSINFCFHLVPQDLPDFKRTFLPMASIESIRFWIKLLSFCYHEKSQHRLFDELKNNFTEMLPSMLKILNFLEILFPKKDFNMSDPVNSAFDFQFASCLIMLLKMYHEILELSHDDDHSMAQSFKIYEIAMRWLTAIHNDGDVPDFDCCLCLLIMVEFILKHLKLDAKLADLTLKKLLGKNMTFTKKLFKFCIQFSNTSLIKEEISGKIRDSSSLPSYGSIYFRGFQSVPIFDYRSPIFMLQCLIRIALSADLPTIVQIPRQTLDCLLEYLSRVTNSFDIGFSSNIFDLIELNVVAQACLVLHRIIRQNPDADFTKESRLIVEFSLMVHVLNDNQIKRDLIQQVLFDGSLYKLPPEDFQVIHQTYQIHSRFAHVFWIFDPLLSHVTVKGVKMEHKIDKIKLEELVACLAFIENLYRTFPEYLSKIKFTETMLFEILCSTFLIDEDCFFDEKVTIILKRFLVSILETSTIVCTIDDVLPHFGTILDLFNPFAKQFDDCSYYNPIYCNYLFVFFQPKCSPYFRNHFLSEYSSSAIMFNFEVKDLLIPSERLLYPIESDLETLETYLKTLLSERYSESYENSVLYWMMVHHLNHALFREDGPKEKWQDEASQKKFQKLVRSIEMSKNEYLRHHLTSREDSGPLYRLGSSGD